MNYCNYTRNISRAIDYIENNPGSKITAAEAVKRAGMSATNFRRAFMGTFGTTIAAYSRGRRLTMIARKLTGTRERIADICMQYGCESPEIITRSFKRMFGMTPAAYRAAGKNMIFLEQQRLTKATIKHVMCGGIIYQPDIMASGQFCIRGIKGSSAFDALTKDIKEMFISFVRTGAHRGHEYIYYALSAGGGSLFKTDERKKIDITVGLSCKGRAGTVVPAGRYAVFRHSGPPSCMPYSYEFIFRYWLKQKMPGKWPAIIFQKIDNKLSNRFRLVSYIYIPF
ncbi:MAG: AraC family transcriptional regulator [Spirochaetia bacterium]|nr:AraC family transcriptional regulator [Spirochaetia bacterium]